MNKQFLVTLILSLFFIQFLSPTVSKADPEEELTLTSNVPTRFKFYVGEYDSTKKYRLAIKNIKIVSDKNIEGIIHLQASNSLNDDTYISGMALPQYKVVPVFYVSLKPNTIKNNYAHIRLDLTASNFCTLYANDVSIIKR